MSKMGHRIGQELDATSSWEVIHDSSLYLTRWMDLLRDIAHDAGGYMSDGDFLELNLQEAFYGTNYARLYELK
ncbi:hypothetical protein DPV78_000303 [Talaromyces pinophilus]|nr:hypothetical protein DPV78_000303 [Talaromyces pinophilus]